MKYLQYLESENIYKDMMLKMMLSKDADEI